MDETEKLENTENQEMKPEYESPDPIRRNQALENAGAGRIHGVMLAKSFCPRYLRRNPRKMRQPLGEL